MNLTDILDKLNGLDPRFQGVVINDALEATKDLRWVPNPGPQTDAYFCEADELFFGGQAGGGKGLRINDLVLTPFGWRKVGDIKEGAALCATDGTVQRVLRRFDRGVQPLFKLTWSDGAETVCDSDHVWLGWDTARSRKIGGKKTNGETSARKWITSEVYQSHTESRERNRPFRFAIPTLSAPCAFNVHGENKNRSTHISREMPGYILGVLLGDGSIVDHVSFCSADPEIPDRVEELLREQHDLHLSRYKMNGVTQAFRIPNAAYKQHLDDLGLLGTRSDTKFIPRIYLLGTVPERQELLRGLMDTDGWADLDGDCYFATTSPQLAKDVTHLARSLGALVTTTEKAPTYTYKGETLKGKKAYALRIKARNPEEMFFLERKAERCRGKIPQGMGRYLTDIQPFGKEKTVCFTVSHPNSLYITDDFIVTHNSDLEIGLALTAHSRSLILRRTNREALGLVERMTEIIGTRDGYSSQQGIWRVEPGCSVEIGGCQLEEDKQRYKGSPHDLISFDEISDFTESQYVFIIGWNRSADPKQRCRIVSAGNPPTRPEGLWVVKRWAAWLDPQHHNPAQPGELRWYTTGEAGKEIEVDGRGPHLINGEEVFARSRTFIPSKLSDNPDLAATDYASTLAALPEELRAAYRDGRFDIGLRDDAFQAIPTAWVRAAQERWKPVPPVGVPMCAIGTDVAQGGNDNTVLAVRHDGWYAPLKVTPGSLTPDGKTVAGLVVSCRRDDAKVVVDIGGGYGGDAYAHLRENGVDAVSYMGVKPSLARTQDNTLRFFNVRSEAYWRFREALDPSQPQGSSIMLPRDAELVADLCAPKYEIGSNGIKIESKESVVKRLGRSPDRGDACIMAWWAGPKQINVEGGWKGKKSAPKVVMKKGR